MRRPLIAILLVLSVDHCSFADQTVGELTNQATQASAAGDSLKAIALFGEVIALQPNQSTLYYLRGREQFRAGKIPESVADFNKFVELSPRSESRQWERGIALYYAGEFEKGAKQFELYQTFHNQDVENSTWRYLCMARSVGVEKARATMLPIESDSRVPMMQIYDLYRGKRTPEEVLAAAKAGDPPPEVLAGRLFYAHLYLGLFYEANGQHDLAKKYILLAADEKLRSSGRINTYMWDVARVHADLLSHQEKGGQKPVKTAK